MITISVPERVALQYLGELPAEVRVLVWDGLGDPPDGADAIELFVGPYGTALPSRATLDRLHRLSVIQLMSAGSENWVPLVPDGVTLHNGRGVHGVSTAELAVTGMLASLRELRVYLDAQQRHDWTGHRSDGLDGRRVLVLGAGDIGARVASVVAGLGAEVTVVARTARDGIRAIADLAALLPVHDVVVLALPHTPDTDRLMDATALAALPDGALVVNVARGPIVDTEALLAELRSRRLHAFLDVTDPEPLPPEHPLWDAPNLILTPHVGGGTAGWRRRAYRLVADQVGRYLRGEELLNQV